MAFQVSPGVVTKEIDLTNVVPAVATSIGAVAGAFEKGPINEIISIGSDNDLVKVFGKPNNDNFEDWFTASNFLQYGNSLRVVRASSAALKNSTSDSNGLLIENDDKYELSYSSGQGSVGSWASRTAGSWGNSIGVAICSGADAYEKTSVTTVTADGAIADVNITVSDSSVFSVGDIVSFGGSSPSGYQYEVLELTDANTIKISLLDDSNLSGLQQAITNGDNIHRRWKFYDSFDNKPESSVWGEANGFSNDELHIVVYDKDGDITGYKADKVGQRSLSIIETFAFVSKHEKAKTPQGGSNYYAKVIFQSSSFIYWMDHPSTVTNWGISFDPSTPIFETTSLPVIDELSGGADDYSPTLGDMVTAYDNFKDAESVNINLLMAGKLVDGDAKANAISLIDLAEYRKDVVTFISPERDDVVGVADSITQTSNVKEFFDQLPSSSYVVFDSGYKYMYDKYNDVYRYVPLNGDIAGLCAYTDGVADPWFSPAGYTRGQIKGVVKLAFNPDKSQRDILYPARINPVISQPGQGTILFGDKTGLTRPSAFDRINVRRLFIVLEKAISTASKFQLFELNDTFTRTQFKNLVEPFLRDVQGRRGIIEFLVKCDTTNNTGEVIDRNEFVADIFIKPTRSINFITLNFIATRSGVSFTEVGG